MNTRRRRTLLATVTAGALAGLAACAGRAVGPQRVADAAAPPRTAFQVYPAAEIAGVRSPHDFRGKALCQRCHAPDLRLTNAPNALCRECHDVGHRSHPVEVVQKTSSGALPLLDGGKLACHSCHDPHQKRSVLRRPFNQLCKECHRGH